MSTFSSTWFEVRKEKNIFHADLCSSQMIAMNLIWAQEKQWLSPRCFLFSALMQSHCHTWYREKSPVPSLAQALLLRAPAVRVKHGVSSTESQAELAARNPAISFWDYQWPLCPVCWLFYLSSQSTAEAVLSNDWWSPSCWCDKLPGPCSILTVYVTQHDFFPSASWKGRSVVENLKLAHAAVWISLPTY